VQAGALSGVRVAIFYFIIFFFVFFYSIVFFVFVFFLLFFFCFYSYFLPLLVQLLAAPSAHHRAWHCEHPLGVWMDSRASYEGRPGEQGASRGLSMSLYSLFFFSSLFHLLQMSPQLSPQQLGERLVFAVLLTAHLALRYPIAQCLPLARMCIAAVASLRSGPSVSPGLAAVRGPLLSLSAATYDFYVTKKQLTRCPVAGCEASHAAIFVEPPRGRW
jgi:hypothetical protein